MLLHNWWCLIGGSLMHLLTFQSDLLVCPACPQQHDQRPAAFTCYRVFNMGFNIIVFFVKLAILFLMMGAFLWLVVAYAANLSIKGGVK